MTEQFYSEDQDLMKRIEQQDETALSALYERYGKLVYSLAYRTLQNPHLAEEVTQETFLKLWRKSGHWDPAKGRLSSWLLTITRYTAIDHLRLEKRQTAYNAASIDDVPPIESEIGLPDAALLHDGQHLRHLMQCIPPLQAEVIELAFFKGLTHRELAAHLDLPLGTVKTRVRLGLQKLKAMWIETMQEPERI